MRRLYEKMVSEPKWNDDACILLTCPERERLRAEIERLHRQLVSDINAETEIDRLETEVERLRAELNNEQERCERQREEIIKQRADIAHWQDEWTEALERLREAQIDLVAERERCARIVDDFEIDHGDPYRTLDKLAAAIREGEP